MWFWNMQADRQTYIHTRRSQYFASFPGAKTKTTHLHSFCFCCLHCTCNRSDVASWHYVQSTHACPEGADGISDRVKSLDVCRCYKVTSTARISRHHHQLLSLSVRRVFRVRHRHSHVVLGISPRLSQTLSRRRRCRSGGCVILAGATVQVPSLTCSWLAL